MPCRRPCPHAVFDRMFDHRRRHHETMQQPDGAAASTPEASRFPAACTRKRAMQSTRLVSHGDNDSCWFLQQWVASSFLSPTAQPASQPASAMRRTGLLLPGTTALCFRPPLALASGLGLRSGAVLALGGSSTLPPSSPRNLARSILPVMSLFDETFSIRLSAALPGVAMMASGGTKGRRQVGGAQGGGRVSKRADAGPRQGSGAPGSVRRRRQPGPAQ